MSKSNSKNVMGGTLQACCTDPMTGFLRDGYCHTIPSDRGGHLVCAFVTEEFLEFSRAQGNDLISPAPEFGFPGLKPGDCWCLCADRWQEAHDAGMAPPIKPESTHEKALEIIDKNILERYYIQ